MKKNLVLASLIVNVLMFVNISYANDLNEQIKPEKIKNYTKYQNGWFLGVEGSTGKFHANTIFGSTVANHNTRLPNRSSATFDLGIIGGYQHYFGYLQKHGIKVSAHFQYGTKNNWNITDIKGNASLVMDFSYMPIRSGLDVKYIYDFYQQNRHTVGLNIGLGYGVDSYVKGDVLVKVITLGNTTVGASESLKDLFAQGVYPVIGFHYYYSNHQFEILYRGGGILDIKGNGETTIANLLIFKKTLASTSYLTLNYTYRF